MQFTNCRIGEARLSSSPSRLPQYHSLSMRLHWVECEQNSRAMTFQHGLIPIHQSAQSRVSPLPVLTTILPLPRLLALLPGAKVFISQRTSLKSESINNLLGDFFNTASIRHYAGIGPLVINLSTSQKARDRVVEGRAPSTEGAYVSLHRDQFVE